MMRCLYQLKSFDIRWYFLKQLFNCQNRTSLTTQIIKDNRIKGGQFEWIPSGILWSQRILKKICTSQQHVFLAQFIDA